MLSYGFANFRPMLAMSKNGFVGSAKVAGGISTATVVPSQDLYDVVAKDRPAPPASSLSVQVYPLKPLCAAPIRPGEKVGTMTLFVAGKPVDTVDALAAASVAAKPLPPTASGWTRKIGPLGTIVLGVVCGVIALAATALVGLVLYARAIAKNSRRRRSRVAQELRTVD
jgi:hypothetical protein